MQSFFDPTEWTYVPDSLGRLDQGVYQKNGDQSQQLSVPKFQKLQQDASEQKVNNQSSESSLDPWSNPSGGGQQADDTSAISRKNRASEQIAQAPTANATATTTPINLNPDNLLSNSNRHNDHKNREFGRDTNEDNVGDNSDDSFICTELYRQGLLSRYEKELNWHYASRHRPASFLKGYQLWARPYVKLMRRSPFATSLIRPFVLSRTQTIAVKLKRQSQNSWLGRFICWIHDPFCSLIGLPVILRNEKNYM